MTWKAFSLVYANLFSVLSPFGFAGGCFLPKTGEWNEHQYSSGTMDQKHSFYLDESLSKWSTLSTFILILQNHVVVICNSGNRKIVHQVLQLHSVSNEERPKIETEIEMAKNREMPFYVYKGKKRLKGQEDHLYLAKRKTGAWWKEETIERKRHRIFRKFSFFFFPTALKLWSVS